MNSMNISGMSMMPAGEHIHTVSLKKVALRELPNESGNIINRPLANSLISKEVLTPDSVKLSGSKRQQPDGPENPSSCQKHGSSTHINLVKVAARLAEPQRQQPDGANPSTCHTQGSPGINLAKLVERLCESKRQQSDGPSSPSIDRIESEIGPHINHVYVRRKSETAQAKTGISGSTNKVESPESRMSNKIVTTEPNLYLNHLQEPKSDSFEVCAPDLLNSLESSSWGPSAVPEIHDSTSKTPVVCDSFGINGQNCKERFLQLQMFLKSCDQSSQEDYVKMLRSLSAAGRSMHAVELEKRAIHLLLEEGKELQRMKVLNVLGKASQNDQPVLPTETSTPLQSHFKRREHGSLSPGS